MPQEMPARPRAVPGLYVRTLGTVAGLKVRAVSGEVVRNDIFLDFTQGGNEAVYPRFVPAGEIWVEAEVGPLDATATVLHEMIERDQMIRHGYKYEVAHDIACGFEREFRKELRKRPPRGTDLAAVARAYRQYQQVDRGGR